MKAGLPDLVFKQRSLERLAGLERSRLIGMSRRRLPEGHPAVLCLDLDLERRVKYLSGRVVGRYNHAEEGLAEVDVAECVPADGEIAMSGSLRLGAVRENAYGRARRGVSLKPDVEALLRAGMSSIASSERANDGLEALSTCERVIIGRDQLKRPQLRLASAPEAEPLD